MSLDDRGLPGEQYVQLRCRTENLSPYSNRAEYTEPTSFFQAECDWQHAQQIPSQQAELHESDRNYYPACADGSDTNTYGYSTYGYHSVSHADFYSQVRGLWPTDNPGDHIIHGQINQHRFFSGIDRTQHGLGQQANSTCSNGKAKRKRVQSHSQRKAANVRERRRMFHLNEAFDELRKRLPAFNYEKRLSRIETLRLAMTYISFMKEVSVGRDPKCVKLKPHGADLSPLPRCQGDMLVSQTYFSDKDNDNSNDNEDSDTSIDEMSNHSEVN